MSAARLVEELDGEPATWVDVLGLIDEAADALTIGDLLHADRFDLQESMSALEIMDPQMDSGMHVAAGGAEEAPAAEPPDEPSHELLIGLFDELLCSEHAWYGGMQLATTVFRINWLYDAEGLRSLPLRAGLLAVARSCATLRVLACRADIHEEEDFSPSVAGMAMHETVPDSTVVDELTRAEEQLVAQLRAMQPDDVEALDAKVAAAALDDVAPAGGGGDAAVAKAEGVLCRLRYRRGLLSALSQLVRPTARSLEVARKMLALAQAQLCGMEASVKWGVSAEELRCCDGQRAKAVLGSAPRGKVELPSREAAVKQAGALLAQLHSATKISTVESFEEFLRWRGAIANEQPCGIMPRSAAYWLGVVEDKEAAGLRPPMAALLSDAIGGFNLMERELWRQVLAIDSQQQLLGQISQGELTRCRLWCMNRARERRRLRHYLSDWAPLQEIADAHDVQLQTDGVLERGVAPFGSWVLFRSLGDQCRFLLLGFELELFSSCEYRPVYWYLDHLISLRLQLLERVQENAAIQSNASNAAAAAAAATKKGKKGKAQKKPVPPVPPYIVLELLCLQAMRELCRGMTLLLSALLKLHLLPPVESEFTPLSTRFERRFLPFSALVRPAPLRWEDYTQVMGSQVDVCAVAGLLTSAERFLKACKASLDKAIKHEAATPAIKADCMAQARVAVANAVFIASSGLGAATSAEAAGAKPRLARFSFASHKQFPTVALA